MKNEPTISVIVPVYNGEQYINDCLESLFKQTHQAKEIIIVDDGSTDNTSSLILSPAILIKTDGRLGAGAARNLGAKKSTGDFLLFTDVDVITPSNWIEKTISVINEKNVRCGGGGYCGPVKNNFMQWFAYEELAWRRRNFYGYVDTLVSNNLFCERNLFLSAGGFPENYRTASSEDMEFSWKISREESIWWEKNNGVLHNFASCKNDYLKQQKRFAIDAVPMMLNKKQMISAKTHHPPGFYIEILLSGLITVLIFASLLIPQSITCLLISIILLLLINSGFLVAMKKHDNILIQTIFLIYVRNITIISGVLVGILRYTRQRKYK